MEKVRGRFLEQGKARAEKRHLTPLPYFDLLDWCSALSLKKLFL